MPAEKEVNKYLQSQKSLHLYKKLQTAMKEVLLSLPNKDFNFVKKKVIIQALHEGALAQVMHFPPSKSNFKIMSIIFPKKIPMSVLRQVVAHEIGHVIQDRNWREGDGMKLEKDADKYAEKVGYSKTEFIDNWIKTHSEKLNNFKI